MTIDLNNVRRPSRYIGNELNAVHKEWESTPLRFALAYPDLYEIGMSNLGLQIIYFLLNSQPEVLAERVFTPALDMEEQLKTYNLPLTTLESGRPLKDFNVVGFSLGHELTYTNIITMLKLGGITVLNSERGENEPLILGGGPAVFNPEPVTPFFDFFLIGEAEEALIEIVAILKDSQLTTRASRLQELAKLTGIYVPGISQKVTKRYVKDLATAPFPTKPIVPFLEAVHDRAALEIMRGCKWGCKFCQAGWTSLPVRERPAALLEKQAEELLKNTGYEELSLLSLSSSDHSQIEELVRTLADRYTKERINLSLPSLRANSFSVRLAHQVARVRSGSLTIAPEAGTQRLRQVIGKKLSEEDILECAAAAFSEGIDGLKLYFMIGLPSETEEDLLGIIALAEKLFQLGRSRSRRTRITINLSTFIPKPHTPFQWEKQISIAETLAKQHFLKQNCRNKFIEIRWHQAEASWLEGIFSRGDRRLAPVIVRAWELGARLDAWGEHLKIELWRQAFADCGVDPEEYLAARPLDCPLPWDFIKTGVTKEALLRAKDKDQV